jgi:hypothetical protein
MEKYTSLEQAIRKAIAEQNYKKAEKPIVEAKEYESLAHTIRNIHEGIAPNDSDKYLGVPAPFLRAPGQGKQQEKVDNQKQNQTLSNSRNRANEFPLNNMKRGRIGDVKEGAALKLPDEEPVSDTKQGPNSAKKYLSPKPSAPSNSNMETPKTTTAPVEPTVAEPETSLGDTAKNAIKYVGSRLLGRLAAPVTAFFNPEIGMGPNPAGGDKELEQEKQRENDWLKRARLDKEKAVSDIKLKPPIEIPDADVKPKPEPKTEPKPETKVAPEVSTGARPSEVPDSKTKTEPKTETKPKDLEKKKDFDLNIGGSGSTDLSPNAIMPVASHGPVRTSTSQINALNQISSLSPSSKGLLAKKIVGSTRKAFKEEVDQIDEMGIGTDKFGGRPGSSYFKSTHISPGNTKSAMKNSGERKVNKQEHSLTLNSKIKEDSTVPNEGNAQTVASLSASGAAQEEDGRKMKKKIKEEADGTKDRTSIENVARPKSAKSPFDRTSKLAKQGEIKQKIIGETAERLHTIKGVIADKKKQNETKTPVEFNPKMKKPDVDTDVVGSSA